MTGDGVEGPAVIVLQQLMVRAVPGAVVIASTVKDLVAGLEFWLKPCAASIRSSLGEWELFELIGE